MKTNTKSWAGPSLKQKAYHELIEFVVLFLYLAFFFCALSTYRMLLLRDLHIRSLTYAFALINALVVAKVIMIGEYAKVGRRYESKPLFLSAVYKAFLFTLLVFGFHVAEEVIRERLHGGDIAESYHHIRTEDLLGRSLLIFSVFITLFGFREVRRHVGEGPFQRMLFGGSKTDKSDLGPEPYQRTR